MRNSGVLIDAFIDNISNPLVTLPLLYVYPSFPIWNILKITLYPRNIPYHVRKLQTVIKEYEDQKQACFFISNEASLAQTMPPSAAQLRQLKICH